LPGPKLNIPRSFPFKRLKRKLAKYNISWDQQRGKGSHGCFVGLDSKGKRQSYPIPYKQQKNINRNYLKALFNRFALTPEQIRDILS